MELRVLRYFLAVAQYQNMTRAAHELLVSQPTLSKQIADLEDELGAPLFIRGHRKITLTEEGEYLQTQAKEIVQLADQTAANIQADQVISGKLSIGAGESVGMQRIMKIVSEIVQDYPDIKVRLVSGNADEMESALRHGTIDFAVFMGKRQLDNYDYLRLPEINTWGLVMKKDDLLASHEFIAPQDLVGLPLLMSEQAIEEQPFQNWWGNLDKEMNIIGTFTLVFNAQLMVSQGNAYMITFDHLINNSNSSDLAFRPLSPALTEPTNVVWKKNVSHSKVAQLFINRLQASLT